MTATPRSVTLAAHADWSIDPRKRWMTLAYRQDEAPCATVWRVASPVPVGDLRTLTARLAAAARGGAVALGVDLPLGLPRRYAMLHAREADFPTFLRASALRPRFFEVCATLAEVAADRPFYPARGVAGMTRAAHAAALGLEGAAALSRACDRATATRPAGAPLFWTLGANQSGKAAISAWRDFLLPALAAPVPPLLWPFDGDLRALLTPGALVIAETYPAEALRHLGLRLLGSKRRQTDRAAIAATLLAAMADVAAAPDASMRSQVAQGFGSDAAGEDRFDSTVGLLCVLNVLAGGRPDGVPADPWLRRWEGWVLGQTDPPLDRLVAAASGARPPAWA